MDTILYPDSNQQNAKGVSECSLYQENYYFYNELVLVLEAYSPVP